MPLSMIICVVAFDPILRWIGASLSPFSPALSAFCDDLCIVTSDVVQAWCCLLRLLPLVRRMSLLTVNVGKTQFLIPSPRKRLECIQALLSSSSMLSRDMIKYCIKYLGVLIGEGGSTTSWVLPIDR